MVIDIAGEGLSNSAPRGDHHNAQIVEICVHHVNWCIVNKESVRVVLTF